jgi:RNA polymerase sigma-70 factor (ECF subfamily)
MLKDVEAQVKSLLLSLRDPANESRAQEIWNEILDLIEQPLIKFLRYVYMPVSIDDQDDMFQEVALRLYRSHRSFDPDMLFLPWLYTIARNVKRDWLKNHNRELATRTELPPEPWHYDLLSQGPNGIFFKALAEDIFVLLSEDEREILWLFHIEGRTETELAAILQVPLTTAKSRLLQARKHARAILNDRSVFPYFDVARRTDEDVADLLEVVRDVDDPIPTERRIRLRSLVLAQLRAT